MVPYGKVTELSTDQAKSPELAKQLWETTEKVVAEDLAKGSSSEQPPSEQSASEQPTTEQPTTETA